VAVMGGVVGVVGGAVMWRRWGLCWQRRVPVTWRRWAVWLVSSWTGVVRRLVSLGAGDVALLAGRLGDGGIDELTPVWPKRGHSPGSSTAAVAAARNGGGGG